MSSTTSSMMPTTTSTPTPTPTPTTTTTTTTTLTTTTTTTIEATTGTGYHSFLDDPYNLAMAVVLPAMIVVYGGCCVIYCVHRLHRYCERRKRRRARQQLLQNKNNNNNINKSNNNNERDNKARIWLKRVKKIEHNSSSKNNNNNKNNKDLAVTESSTLSIIDLTAVPESGTVRWVAPCVTRFSDRASGTTTTTTTPKATSTTKASNITITDAGGFDVDEEGRGACEAPLRTELVAVLPGEKRPEYQQDVQRQMKHLDEQLKAAFRMISHHSPDKTTLTAQSTCDRMETEQEEEEYCQTQTLSHQRQEHATETKKKTTRQQFRPARNSTYNKVKIVRQPSKIRPIWKR